MRTNACCAQGDRWAGSGQAIFWRPAFFCAGHGAGRLRARKVPDPSRRHEPPSRANNELASRLCRVCPSASTPSARDKQYHLLPLRSTRCCQGSGLSAREMLCGGGGRAGQGSPGTCGENDGSSSLSSTAGDETLEGPMILRAAGKDSERWYDATNVARSSRISSLLRPLVIASLRNKPLHQFFEEKHICSDEAVAPSRREEMRCD